MCIENFLAEWNDEKKVKGKNCAIFLARTEKEKKKFLNLKKSWMWIKQFQFDAQKDVKLKVYSRNFTNENDGKKLHTLDVRFLFVGIRRKSDSKKGVVEGFKEKWN